ncbi:hypothetical protein ACNKF0_08670 [Nocardioides sp. T5]|uniref:hypothetical protein n=1 Tax=Nocardioides sp. T5 TaxID=3400182 RepID=UPI003A8A5F0E
MVRTLKVIASTESSGGSKATSASRLRRRGAGREQRGVLAPGTSPDGGAVGTEPVLDRVTGQVGQVTQRAEAEPLQQPDELAPARAVVLQHVHGQAAQEGR